MSAQPAVPMRSVPARHPGRHDRRFFIGMAAASAVTIFVGFAPTYYLKGVFAAPALPPLVHLHGVLFTAWIVLLAAQTSLVAVGKVGVHRRLGVAGAFLAGLMTVVGLATAVGAARRGAITPEILIIPMGSVILFPALVAAAVATRARPDAHKRWIAIATIELLTAGVGRWPVVRDWSALGMYAMTDVFLAGVIAYDVAARRRVHPATAWGGSMLVASQLVRVVAADTDAWRAFAAWLAG
jgi:hypothetical protein